jgi:hypothetical protein
MTLYKKVREIPASDELDIETKGVWSKFFDSMNLDFEYMLANGWLVKHEIDLGKKIVELEARVKYLESNVSNI